MKFSVIMPTFNREKYISAAIDSILHQTVSDWELLIVDDASNDNTENVILQYKDARIKYIRLSPNRGVARARNVGYKMSQGEYVVIADSDDVNHPERLEKMGLYLDNNREIDIAVTDIQIIDEDDRRGAIMEYRKSNEEIRVGWLFQPMLPSFMMFRKREIQSKNKLYHDESFRAAVDYQWYSNLDIDSKIGVVPEVLYFYRRHQHQISTEGYEIQQNYADLIRQNLLNTLKITSTEMERKLHSSISQNVFAVLGSAEFEQSIRWFEKIIEANKQSNVFNHKILQKILQEKLLGIIECAGFVKEEFLDILQRSKSPLRICPPFIAIEKKPINEILSRKNRVYIYGCKWTGYCIGRHILDGNGDFIGYVDGNQNIWGQKMLGKPIVSVNDACNIDNSIIIISVLSQAKHTIADSLVKLHGVHKENIFFFSQL